MSIVSEITASEWETPVFEYPVPMFAFAFPENEKAVFILRGVTRAGDYLPVLFADRQEEGREALLQAADFATEKEDIIPALREIAYNAERIKQKTAMYKALCLLGIKSPEVDRKFINWLAANHAILFLSIAQKIEELSAMGNVRKKK